MKFSRSIVNSCRLAAYLCVLLSAVMPAGCASGGQSEGTYARILSGRLVFSDGLPLSDSRVEVQLPDGAIIAATATNAAGEFEVAFELTDPIVALQLLLTPIGAEQPLSLEIELFETARTARVEVNAIIDSSTGEIDITVTEVPIASSPKPTAVGIAPSPAPPAATQTGVPPTGVPSPNQPEMPSKTPTATGPDPAATSTPAPAPSPTAPRSPDATATFTPGPGQGASPTPSLTPSPGGQNCPGDLNADGLVNNDDLSIILAAFGTTIASPNFAPEADLNGDGIINQVDLGLWESYRQQSGGVCP